MLCMPESTRTHNTEYMFCKVKQHSIDSCQRFGEKYVASTRPSLTPDSQFSSQDLAERGSKSKASCKA